MATSVWLQTEKGIFIGANKRNINKNANINKQCVSTKFNLFESIIATIVLYASEIRGISYLDEIDRKQTSFNKKIILLENEYP